MPARKKAHQKQTSDLCGIAKGYALDRMVAALVALGQQDVFVELGGEVAARGLHPAGRPWRAGIESPLPGTTHFQRRVVICNETLATSGDRVNSFVHGAHRYSHIIDPARKRPVDTPLASVSAFAPRAITADALATALFAMGPEKGPAFAEASQIPALFILRDGSVLREEITAGFDSRVTG